LKLNHFHGLYGDQTFLQKSDFLHCEALEIRSKTYKWEIEEHFHTDLFQIFFIEHGDGTLSAGKQKMEIVSPALIVIPANTLHGFHFIEGIKGGVLTVSERFLEKIFGENSVPFLDSKKRTQVSYRDNENEFQSILGFYNEISAEITENAADKDLALKPWFELLFLKLYRNTKEVEKRELLLNNRTLVYYGHFLHLIKKNINQSKKVSEFASDLQITTVHLNRICREISGKSALEVIQEILIAEAKNYLLNTSYTVSEIAYFLNFNDPAYFNRMFKKLVGAAPGVFRKH
jgi:AraC family transcriptional activator of pobA